MSWKADERRAHILSDLAESREVSVALLSKRFGVSEVMIRRDLDRLERNGLLRRVHGGAVPVPPPGPRQLPHASHQAEKERIGRAAAGLISPGDRVILDSGTTVLQLARHIPPRLRSRGDLTVVTNSLHILRELGPCSAVEILLLGGIYLPQFEILVGPKTVQSLRELRVEKIFIGAKGLTLERGITTDNILEAETDHAAVEAAAEVILLADSSKIGQDSLTAIVPLTRVRKFITDTGASADFVAALRGLSIEVILV